MFYPHINKECCIKSRELNKNLRPRKIQNKDIILIEIVVEGVQI